MKNGKKSGKKQDKRIQPGTVTVSSALHSDVTPQFWTLDEITTLTKIKALAEEEREKTKRRSPQGQYTRQKPESKSST